MKPVAQRMDRRSEDDFSLGRRFPLTDFNYQSFPLDRFRGDWHGDDRSDSFFDISRNYFAREARRHFVAEVAFFIVMAAILVGALIELVRAIIPFLQLPSA